MHTIKQLIKVGIYQKRNILSALRVPTSIDSTMQLMNKYNPMNIDTTSNPLDGTDGHNSWETIEKEAYLVF
jgi:hypothetical protein